MEIFSPRFRLRLEKCENVSVNSRSRISPESRCKILSEKDINIKYNPPCRFLREINMFLETRVTIVHIIIPRLHYTSATQDNDKVGPNLFLRNFFNAAEREGTLLNYLIELINLD